VLLPYFPHVFAHDHCFLPTTGSGIYKKTVSVYHMKLRFHNCNYLTCLYIEIENSYIYNLLEIKGPFSIVMRCIQNHLAEENEIKRLLVQIP
jgi:hypothetical protein